jgi:hypothetical protein
LEAGRVAVSRAASCLDEATIRVKDPNSSAGRRTLAVPPQVLPILAKHLDRYVGPEADALIVTGKQVGPAEGPGRARTNRCSYRGQEVHSIRDNRCLGISYPASGHRKRVVAALGSRSDRESNRRRAVVSCYPLNGEMICAERVASSATVVQLGAGRSPSTLG